MGYIFGSESIFSRKKLTWTRWEIEVAIFASFALGAIELAAAGALPGNKITNVIQRTRQIAIAR